MYHILKCFACGKFTMNELCVCGEKALTVRPPKYSPQDKYADYRRKAKESELKQKGLL